MFAGEPPEPEFVYHKLRENPAFARTCGFTIRRPGKRARQSDVRSLRKLQQFDQIMTENGLWAEVALDQVADNLRSGTMQAESTVVHDTTHYHAYSAIKNCRCARREHCDHSWINADEGAGTVVKSTGKMYWAHKASTLCFADQEVLLDAVALHDAASHDSLRSILAAAVRFAATCRVGSTT